LTERPKESSFFFRFILLQDRTTRTLLLSALLILGMGSLRPQDVSGIYYKSFWSSKATWRGCCDVVIAGDSRVVIGLSPQQMGQFLPGLRILNFGFYANGYSLAYLEAIEQTLDTLSPCKTIILGISPRSLTARSEKLNFFTVYSQQSNSDKFLVRYFDTLLRFTDPLSLSDVWHNLLSDEKQRYFRQCYFPDGWIASDKRPLRPDQKLDNYILEFKDNPVSEEIITKLLSFVKQWTQAGIYVYAFRPPSSKAMVELENKYAKFDQTDFVNSFKAAGGLWIDLDQNGYQSYDGSHLLSTEALKLSEDIARFVKRKEE